MAVTTGPAAAAAPAPRRTQAIGPVLRLGVPVVVLAVLVQHVGTRPFVRALDRVTLGSVLAAVVVTAATTLCAAGRWRWVARRLDLRLDLRSAVAAYYRSQLLNQALPGGVLGDVERAARHGLDQAALGRAARAVAWERALGQVGLLAVALVLVTGLSSAPRDRLLRATEPATTATAVVVTLLLAGLVAGLVAAVLWRRRGRAHVTATLVADVRRLAAGGLPWQALLLSVAAASGHLLVLLVALRTAGVDLPVTEAMPLLAVVLVASSLPTNLAGWGPREGAAAWVFAAAGLTAADGVTVATLYGLLSLAATAPGAVILAVSALPRRMEAQAT